MMNRFTGAVLTTIFLGVVGATAIVGIMADVTYHDVIKPIFNRLYN